MPRKPTQQRKSPHRNVLHLRLDEELRSRLQHAADAHRFPLVREIRHRLEDSLDTLAERAAVRTMDEAGMDMSICWARFAARFLSRELADQLADAVVAWGDAPERIRSLARLIIERRDIEQRAPSWERRL